MNPSRPLRLALAAGSLTALLASLAGAAVPSGASGTPVSAHVAVGHADPAEPAGAEPAATEPAATEPAGAEPAATEPAGAESAGAEPAATEPAGAESAGAEPAATEPAGAQPAALLDVGLTAAGTLAPDETARAETSLDELRTTAVDDPDRATAGQVTTSAVNDPLRSLQWYLDRVRAPAAWGSTEGEGVVVAVIDTGVDPGHPDLDGAFFTDPRTGANGFDHLRAGTTTYESEVKDWHGTAIAGIVGARADDGFGIAGLAPRAQLMVHRIYASGDAETPPSDTSYTLAARAITAAASQGADVILLTWGGTTPNAELVDAIRNARVPVVAAAGNDGQNFSDSPSVRRYPAMYRLPNLVTVAATDRENQILDNGRVASNYGVRHVDIAAPGEEIVSLWPGGGHEVFEGTSFAAPQVAAALALGRAMAPGTPTPELVGALVGTARRHPGLLDKVVSGGVLDVQSFLRAVERPVCTPNIPPSSFIDVDRRSTHVGNIDCVAYVGLTVGDGDGAFHPRRTVTRGEMATFISRLLTAGGHEFPELDRLSVDATAGDATAGDATADATAGATAVDDPGDGGEVTAASEHDAETNESTLPFSDIAGTTHVESIVKLAETGLVSGVGDGRFAPAEPVTRAHMATFVVNAVEFLLGTDLTSERDWFDDVGGSVHEEAILVARDLGVTLGTSEPREFAPERRMTREQMASFLARTLDAVARQGVVVERVS